MAEPPRVFTIPAGVPFADALAAGLLARAGDPLRLADTLVLLPTRRACRALRDGFLRAGGGQALLLPRLVPIGDVDEDALDADAADLGLDDAEIPPAIAPLRRQVLLARMLLAARRGLDVGGPERAMRLAAELARLLDDAQTARVDLAGLRDLAPEAHADHWRKSLAFLAILTEHWPRVLAEEGRIDPADRRDRLLGRLAARWRAAPPDHPVIAAGSTGSVPAAADLIATVAGLPAGAVVLPGLDQGIDEASWRALGDSHPQAALRRLLDRLDLPRDRVIAWPHGDGRRASARVRLLADALRPAETLGAWTGLAAPTEQAVEGLTRVDCPTPQVEAGVIALAMRETLETPGATAALVTRDRTLARRVAEELGRWGIAIDDSAGRPLGATPPGAFLRLAAAMAESDAAPVPLLALLKHPLAAGGRDPAAFRAVVREIERVALRGPRPAPGFKGLRDALDGAGLTRARNLVRRLGRAAGPFMGLMGRRRVALPRLIDAHVAFAEALAASAAEPGADRLWARDDGEALARFVAEARDAAGAMAPIRGADYPGLLDALMAGRVARPRFGLHPRLAILGPLEARLQGADLVILGGLNEGSWPPLPDPDPWLSRPMRAALGLPARETRIGQAAHDFVLGAAAPRVLLTRAAKIEGTPTVASRWLVRLETLLAGHGRDAALAAGADGWLAWQAALDRPARVAPMARPRPAPPVALRPRRLSVTQVETWIADPYAIYAKAVLGLVALDPVDADPGAAERGQFIHDALDRFVKAYPDAVPADALDRLLDHGRDAFGAALARPDVHAFWWPRFERIAAWFVEQERGRRAGLARVLGEATGHTELAGPAGPFELRAKADRVEIGADGAIGLIDYKTGAKPVAKAAREGRAPQLALEAVIAAHGGFDGVPAGPIADLAFWHLTGGEPAGETIAPKKLLDTFATAEAGLARLIARFDDPATPYLACPRADLAPKYNDYADLERLDEGDAAPAEVPPFRPMPASRPAAPAPPLPEQRVLSDPATSAWVAASAGTGKTKVLTDRVLRLLLAGCAPGRLLCLTFTKAAAAEMAIRIERRLGAWAIASPPDLARDLAGLMGAPPKAEALQRARRLFADVLETPGGLPIMTIHAFCQALLARFPVEAGVAPGFEIADPRTARELQAEALDAVIARSKDDALLGPAMAVIAARSGDTTVRGLIEKLVDDRGRFAALLRAHGGVDGAIVALRRALGVARGETVESLVRETVDPAFMDEPALRRAAMLLSAGEKMDRALAAGLNGFLGAPVRERTERQAAYIRLFLTKKDEARKDPVSAKTRRARPDVAPVIAAEAARMLAFVERRNRVVTAEASTALYRVGDAVLGAYAARKAARGLLDYQDLILVAADLVSSPGAAPWVLYKLDGGIDHILVDEAQDTNPDQWRIVTALSDEFFAGEGAREGPRTLFVVGDEKQSIFSFQGADLDGLARVRQDLRARAEAAGARWIEQALTRSFRSAPAVLRAVDTVFDRPEARAGVAADAVPIRHVAHRTEAPGTVEVWPLVGGKPDPSAPWDVPTDYAEASDPTGRLAAHIAATILGWIGGGAPLAAHGRAIRPGDIMVLVRRRHRLMHAIVRELRRRGVPVAGVDRMVLIEPLAVRDLLGLIEAALMPEDDLTLAGVLKGPLAGLDEDALHALAAGRGRGVRLWSALGRAARRGGPFARAHRWLKAQFARADFATPYGFLSAALNDPSAQDPAVSGRHALLARLGLEAEDPIDELLTQALAYEQRHAPTLQGFARWLGRSELEITRDLEHGRDEVRVLTVHGAKGLEAPIVILPDTTELPHGQGPALAWTGADGWLVWSGRAAFAESLGAEAKEARKRAEAAEHRRLLYVALTRAADRLIVAGTVNRDEPREGSWYDLVREALEPAAERLPFDAWDGEALRLASGAAGATERRPAETGPPPPPLPAWMRAQAPVDAPALPPLAPSRGPDEPPAGSPGAGERDRRLRGRLIHRLLERLPDVSPGARAVLAERLLARHGADLDAKARAEIAASARALLEAPGLAALFGPGSRAEVPIVGLVGDRVVAGQVDRLVVGADEIVIADYKSDRAPPAEAPAAYRRQMALYAAVLRQVFPGRAIRALLVWTEGPRVTTLTDLA